MSTKDKTNELIEYRLAYENYLRALNRYSIAAQSCDLGYRMLVSTEARAAAERYTAAKRVVATEFGII